MVLHYSQLLSADSPNHPPPPSLPPLHEFKTPYDFHGYDPLIEYDDIPPTPYKDHDTSLIYSPQKDIDDDQVSLRDNLDTNLLEGVDVFSLSESITTLPVQLQMASEWP